MPRPPSNGRVTSKFGPRPKPTPTSPAFHFGEDTVGVGNYAPCTGTVVFARAYGALGNVVVIRADGPLVVHWLVAHHASISVRVGGRVTEGVTFLGPLGSTGNVTGPHAHTERRVGGNATPQSGVATNPRLFYTSSAGGGVSPILKEDDVKIVHTTDTNEYFRAGELSSFKITAAEAADSARLWGQVEMTRADFQSEANLANAANDKLIAEMVQKLGISQGADPAAIQAAAKAGSLEALTALKIPTAAENGLAARAAIVK